MACHHESAADDLAELARIEQSPAGLDACAHEGVGRTADDEPALCGKRDELLALLQRRAERLLRIDVLACKERCLRDIVVLIGTGLVDDDVDLVIRK